MARFEVITAPIGLLQAGRRDQSGREASGDAGVCAAHESTPARPAPPAPPQGVLSAPIAGFGIWRSSL